MEDFLSAYTVSYKDIEVVIEVKGESAYLFKAKNFVQDQVILKEYDDGRLLVKFTATTYKDVDDMLKSQIPNIKIIQPKEFKDKFLEELQKYFTDIDS